MVKRAGLDLSYEKFKVSSTLLVSVCSSEGWNEGIRVGENKQGRMKQRRKGEREVEREGVREGGREGGGRGRR